MENDWQGVPPTRRSGASTSPAMMRAGMDVMSPRFGMSGWRCASTAFGNRSISLNHAGRHPRGCHAQVAASMPEQTLP